MWIAFTLFAAFNQALRTALQKQAAASLPAFFVAWMRFAFGLPFALAWCAIWMLYFQLPVAITTDFAVFTLAAAVSQLGATYCAVHMLTLRNFAVGTTWIKSEAIFTAIFAMLFFGLAFSLPLLLAAIIGAGGLMLLNQKGQWFNRSTLYGIGAGSGFAICSLFINKAALALQLPFLLAGAVTLVGVLVVQVIIATPLLNRLAWKQLTGNKKVAWLIGLTSALGSIGWFSAMALVTPAMVKTLGQSEFIFTLLITYFYFGERLTKKEWIGVAIVMSAVLLLLLA